MFESLTAPAPDKIIALIGLYAADPRPAKVDLGIGAGRADSGVATPSSCRSAPSSAGGCGGAFSLTSTSETAGALPEPVPTLPARSPTRPTPRPCGSRCA